MKKIFYCLCAASAMLFTACSDEATSASNGKESIVSFTTELPENINTRAFADGLTATKLSYAVYEKDSQTPLVVSKKQVTFDSNRKATVNLRLANGKSYDILFWADAPTSPYTFDENAQTITVDYNATANDETRDAFFWAEKDLAVNGAVAKDILLYRPFAQVNVGAQDYDAATTVAFKTVKSEFKVNTVYTTLNLHSGEVSNETAATFALSNIPAGTETFPVVLTPAAKYLAMNYLLMAKDKELVDVTFTAQAEDGAEITRNFNNIPVQRNYRTNIYGNILTETADFNIQIVPEFNNPDFNVAQ